MLGTAQKQWFLNQVTSSTATWKVWANEVMLCQYLFGPPLASTVEYFDLDQWDGYPAERAEILTAIKTAGVQNFIVISGDAHLYLTSVLRTNFNNPAEPPMGVEFMVGAISSGNYLDAGVEPPPASLPSLTPGGMRVVQSGLPMDTIERVVLAYNPHMTFWNGASWGYAILTVTPQRMICDYRVASTIKQPTATLQQLASFTVLAGVAAVTQTA